MKFQPTLNLPIVHQGLSAVRDHHVLIAINVMQPKTQTVGLEVTLSDPTSWIIAQQWITDKQNAGWNIYFHANPVRTGLAKKAKKTDMLPCDMLQGDVDPTAGVPYEKGRQDAWNTVQSLRNSTTPPTLIFDSGNGFYPLVRLDRPLSVEEYDHANKAWNAASGIVGTFNADRLLKVPGSVAFNDAKKQARGYPPTSQAGIVALGGPILPTDTLLATVASYAPPDRAVRSKATETDDSEFSAAEMTDSLGSRIATLRAKHSAFNAAMGVAPDGGDRSAMLLVIARFLSGAGFTTHEYVAAVEDVSKSAMDHVEDQPYPRRTLRRAWDHVRPRPEDMPDISTLTLPASGPWDDMPDELDQPSIGGTMPEGTDWWQDVDPVDVMEPFMAPTLPKHCIPPILRPLMELEGPAMGVPPEIMFASCIGAAVAALDDRNSITPHANRNWTEHPRLWLAMIAMASAKKTPAMNMGLKPAKLIDKKNAGLDGAAIAQFEINLKRYNMELKKFTDGKADTQPEGTPPTHPITNNLFVNDATVAKLSDILKHNPRGIMMERDELSGWFASVEGRGEAAKDRANYLQLYNGGSNKIDRVGRGSVHVENWSASIVGGIQPAALVKAMANSTRDDGLLQRFYPFIARKVDVRATNASVDPSYQENFNTIIERLAGVANNKVYLSQEAWVILDKVWGEIHQLITQGNLSEMMVSHLSKWEGGLYRWALVLHSMQCVENGWQPFQYYVSAETAQIVADLHMDYFLPNVFSLYNDVLGEGGDAEHVRWIAGHILANKTKVLTLRNITRPYRAWRPLDETQKRRVLRYLEDAGWINAEDDNFLPKRWSVNPTVYSKFKDVAEQERARRTEIMAKIRVSTKDT